nr:MAG TPA: hypothetical protein [Caudoviricetes sp.]
MSHLNRRKLGIEGDGVKEKFYRAILGVCFSLEKMIERVEGR